MSNTDSISIIKVVILLIYIYNIIYLTINNIFKLIARISNLHNNLILYSFYMLHYSI